MNGQDKLLDGLIGELDTILKFNDPNSVKASIIYNRVKQILAKAQKGEQRIRELLWATHPCEGKYSDDGELQCGRFLPPIDFKRDSWETIAQRIEKHTEQRIEESLKKV